MANIDNYMFMPEWHDVDATSPQTEIRLCSGVPWSNDYRHVRKFLSSQQQYEEITGNYAVHTYNSSTPVRIGSNKLEIPYYEVAALNVNYVVFKNLPYDNAWYYAFVTSVEYLSPNSTKITIELDVWQNNHLGMTILPSYVERMTVPASRDIPGAYTYPEGLEVGEYKTISLSDREFSQNRHSFRGTAERSYIPMTQNDQTVTYNDGWCLELYATSETDGTYSSNMVADGIWQGVRARKYSGDGASLNDALPVTLATYAENNNLSSVIDAVLLPDEFGFNSSDSSAKSYVEVLFNIYRPDNIDGYVPRNKKLLTYPYTFVSMSNGSATNEYRYEFFSDKGFASFKYTISQTMQPTMYITPLGYLSDNIGGNDRYCMTFDNFPHAGLSSDTFRAWFAQNNISLTASAATGIAETIGGAAMANPAMIGAGVTTLVNTAATVQQHETVAPSALVQASGIAALANNTIGILVSKLSIRSEYAKKIDGYFDKYGYAINDISQITLSNRPYYEYIKTRDVSISGKMELADNAKLRSILDSGVTVWHTSLPGEFGNYSLKNR